MVKVICAAIIVVVLASSTAPLLAHHAWPVDQGKLVTVTGTVTKVEWAEPHPMFTIEARAANGRTETWQIGGPAIVRMEANGCTKTTLKVGDVVTGTGHQFTDGQKIVRLERVVLSDGKEMRVYAR